MGARLRMAARVHQWSGVLDKMLTAPDRFAMVPIEDARGLWLRRDPLLVQRLRPRGARRAADLNTGAAVGWRPGRGPDAVARRIQAVRCPA